MKATTQRHTQETSLRLHISKYCAIGLKYTSVLHLRLLNTFIGKHIPTRNYSPL